MKKIYTLISALSLITTVAAAQENLVENGGFENWTDETTLEGYETFSSEFLVTNQGIMREEEIVHEGTYSLRHTSVEEPTQGIEPELIAVTAGETYTISYWYLDNSDTARTRLWSTWLNEDFGSLPSGSQGNVQESDYSVNSPQWVNKQVTVTAPEGAAFLRYQVRTYRENVGQSGGYIYYDAFSLTEGNTASVKNNTIEGLKIYPNPVTGNVVTITSNANNTKTVAIYDVLGKEVVNVSTASGAVNVAGLTSGIYIVKITEENKTATRKLIVK